MNLIERFTYFTFNPHARDKKLFAQSSIKNELERPVIKFENKNSEIVDLAQFRYYNSISNQDREYAGVLYQNNHYSRLNFNKAEILFLVEKYNLSFIEDNDAIKLAFPKEYYVLIGQNNIDEKPYINFKFLIDKENKEYLVISFIRYPKDYPERAKDQSAPFLTYIHGIWENPMLTDEIIEKIKNS